jgi:bifunctional DNA-binding transcriptional regulator/antitoxin component of YhaV-PrlF toxin-antitoxin module
MALHAVSNKQGRLTIPAEARAALNVEGETHWTIEVADGALVLRPAVVIPREDAWLYTSEERAKREQAREQARTGRSYGNVRPDDLEDLSAGRVTVEELEARLVARRETERANVDAAHSKRGT